MDKEKNTLEIEIDIDEMNEFWNSRFEHIQDNNDYDYWSKEWLYLHPSGHYFLQNIEGKVKLLSKEEAEEWIKSQEVEE